MKDDVKALVERLRDTRHDGAQFMRQEAASIIEDQQREIESTRETLQGDVRALRRALDEGLEVIKMAYDLTMVIEQMPNNVWHVAAYDPETAVCNVHSALEEFLAKQGRGG